MIDNICSICGLLFLSFNEMVDHVIKEHKENLLVQTCFDKNETILEKLQKEIEEEEIKKIERDYPLVPIKNYEKKVYLKHVISDSEWLRQERLKEKKECLLE